MKVESLEGDKRCQQNMEEMDQEDMGGERRPCMYMSYLDVHSVSVSVRVCGGVAWEAIMAAIQDRRRRLRRRLR